MDAGRQSDLLDQFVGITGTTPEKAKFFLECAAWDCDLAIANFFEDPHEDVVMDSESDDDVGFPIDPPSRARGASPPRTADEPSAALATNSKATAKPTTNTRIATLGSLQKKDVSSEDEDEGQAFYAGGSDSGGGQQILGPKKKRDPGALVADMFKTAKEHGAEILDPSQMSANRKRPSYFHGAAYRLGGENDPGGPLPSTSAGVGAQARPQTVDVILRFWENGFSVDNGPLRDFHDPANLEFLNDIKNGKIPRELVQMAKGRTVTLDMEDRSHEDYVRPKVAVQAFSGHGYRLGNPTEDGPYPAAQHVQMSKSGSSVDQQLPPTNGTTASSSSTATDVEVDTSLPMTNLQIRLPDGSRLVTKFNHTHTIAEVRKYIVQCRPNYSESNFILMTTFPSKEITDESSTLASANLINTVLVVRMK